jgi:hypothetical protein
MNTNATWYILQTTGGNCQIVEFLNEPPTADLKYWGPFSSREDAVAHRVGLIRAGKCQPQ